jgi:integrase
MGTRPDGTVDRRHLRRKQKADLVKAVRNLERSRDTGTYQWTEDDPTLQKWVEHWLEAILPMTARRKTLSTYRSQMHAHLLPTLGQLRLSQLRPEHLEILYVTLSQHGRSTHTIRAVHRVARSALNEAVRRRRLLSNPALIARPPRLVETEVEPLTVDECHRVLAAAVAVRNSARWSLALALGLRQGEALGLIWTDIDFEVGTLKIRRSIQRWTYQHGCTRANGRPSCGHKRGADCPDRHDGGLRFVEPKTASSRRVIVLPMPLAADLKAHRARQAEERLVAGPAWTGNHDLVFATTNGEIIDPKQDGQEWKHLLRTAQVRAVRVHDARHTAATLLLLQETDLRTVMAIMGWTQLATAQRYTHAVDDLRRRAATKMGDMLWGTTPEPAGRLVSLQRGADREM